MASANATPDHDFRLTAILIPPLATAVIVAWLVFVVFAALVWAVVAITQWALHYQRP